MTLRKKLFLSNIVMVLVPLFITFFVLGIYIHSAGSGIYALSSDSGKLADAQDILYFYETELSKTDWTAVTETTQADSIPSDSVKIISELYEMGYRIFVKCGDEIIFDNTEKAEKQYLELTKNSEMLIYNNYIIINDSFEQNGKTYVVTAAYNTRSDKAVQNLFLPVYMLPPDVMVMLIVIFICAVVIFDLLITYWLRHSVLEPMDILKQSAKEIADGNFGNNAVYDKKDEFGEVCFEFGKMKEKLAAAESERKNYENYRRELLLGISHDIRTPLTSVKGYTEGLIDGIADTEEKRQRYYSAILTRAKDMERLADSLHILTGLENAENNFVFEKTEIGTYIRSFIEEEKACAEKCGAVINYGGDSAKVKLDKREFRRVFTNLLANSVKYCCRTDISVNIKTTVSGDKIIITYKDNGTGVPEDKLERIFDSFYRTDESRTRTAKGSGLGLAIVKRIVNEHSGEIRAFNDNGLCAEITLPVCKEGDN